MDILLELKNLSVGQDFIDFSKKIIKTKYEILGVKVPALRKLAREVFKEGNYLEFLSKKSNIYEVNFLKGLVIAENKDRNTAKKLLKNYYPLIDNWAMVDIVVQSLKSFDNDEESFNYFKRLIKSEEEFISRCGAVGFIKFFSTSEDNDRVIEALKELKCEKYYLNMAISWLICEMITKNPQNAVKILTKIEKNTHLNDFIIDKAIQKALESYRIDKNLKQKLREMKYDKKSRNRC